MREVRRTVLQMGTVVDIRMVSDASIHELEDAIAKAQAEFQHVESICSRFDAGSELRQLSNRVGQAVPVSDVLFETLRFATAMAEETDGLFDPTVGRTLHAQGFRRNYLSGEDTPDEMATVGETSYRDVIVDPAARTVKLQRPLTLDLGAVAKGFAIDLAAKVLNSYEGFVIDAGGDVYVGGLNANGEPWRVGIRHPLRTNETIRTLRLTDVAVCTSGGYERRSSIVPGGHHLIHPQTGVSPVDMLSSTVIAPYAMLADACSTTAFLMGAGRAIASLEDLGLQGMVVDDRLSILMTQGMERYLNA